MVYLTALSSSECLTNLPPWRFLGLSRVPQEAFKDKAARDAWINLPGTQFHCYSMYEGVQANLRLRGSHAGQDDNPPLEMHGLSVDYDAKMTVADAAKSLSEMMDCPPMWFEQTLSGNGRLVWMFQSPLKIPSRKFLLYFLDAIHEKIPYRKLPGLDTGALKPERYFTNGCRWTLLTRQKVSRASLVGFALKASEKVDWTAREFGKASNLEDIATECKKVFPRFNEWPGDFTVGAVGPSFWIDGSTSPKSAIVRDTGMQTFAAHATKAFYPWAELVGANFVEENENLRLGKAVEDVWFDERSFITKDAGGKFIFHTKDNLRMILQGTRGLQGKLRRDGQLSEVDRAIVYIMQNNVVSEAASWAFFPHGVFNRAGRRILNTHQIEVLKPAEELTDWGATGKFPWLSAFLDRFFSPKEPQLNFFLAWIQYAYVGFKNRNPKSGHAMFIAGPVGCGKTFLARKIVGAAFGGFADANAHLTGADNFNAEMFEVGIWVIDDGSIGASERVHAIYSENVKRSVANKEHRVNGKFKKAGMVEWQGRMLVTMNPDPESLRMAPNSDISMLEKMMLLRAGEKSEPFPPQDELAGIVERELPYFLAWLSQWKPPEYCFDGPDNRFGIKSYADKTLLDAANLSSGKNVFVELLIRWLTDYFNEQQPQATYWEGTTTDLRVAMASSPVYSELLRPYRPENLPRMIVAAMNKGVLNVEVVDEKSQRKFRILRDDKFSKAVKQPPVPQSENSRFEKP